MFLIVFGAKYLYIVVGLIAITVFFLSSILIKNKLLLHAAVVFPISYLLSKLFGYFIQSPRPFIVSHIKPLIDASTDNGFPSDHTLLAMAVASVIFVYNRKVGSLLILLAILVGLSRVLVGVHHPIDVIGSIVISVFTTYIVHTYLFKYLGKKLQVNKKL